MDRPAKSGLSSSSSSISIALPPSVPHKPAMPMADRHVGGGGIFDRSEGSSYSNSRHSGHNDAHRRRPSPSKDSSHPPLKRHDHRRSPSPERRYNTGSSKRGNDSVWDHHDLESEGRPRYDDRDRRRPYDDRDRYGYDRGGYPNRPREDDFYHRGRRDDRAHETRPSAYHDDGGNDRYRPQYADERSPRPRGRSRSRSPRMSRDSPRHRRNSYHRRSSFDGRDSDHNGPRRGNGPTPSSSAMAAADSADTEEGEIPDTPSEAPPSSPEKAIVDKYRPKKIIRPANPSKNSFPLVSPSEPPAPPPEPSGVPPPPPGDAPPLPVHSPSGPQSSIPPPEPRPSPYGAPPTSRNSNGHPPDRPSPYGAPNDNGLVNPYAPAAKPANRKVQDLQGHGDHATPHAPNRDLLNPSTRAATPQGERPVKVEVPPKLFTRRTADEELTALGKQFFGTNGLEAYDLGTKLGEGTFG